MRLVFIHGWGFDARIWNGVAGCLPHIPHIKGELGFLGQPPVPPVFQDGDILVGHSLGFLWGMAQGHFFPRWVAINSFACFTHDDPQKTCVPSANLRALRRNLARDPQKTLRDFHTLITSPDAPDQFDAGKLDAGIALLETLDLGESLLERDNHGLILAAQDDALVPVAATEYLASNCRTVDIMWKAGGHILPITEPDWCATQIEKFLNDV
jgi:pimeloyl-[acyl-carrier protein] methyl ester esterase